ncbi:hypothetical protein PHAVU_006G115100, partial [Phaseolus vulgaris]
VLEVTPLATIRKVAMLLWSLWRRRNCKIWEDKACSPRAVIQNAMEKLTQRKKMHPKQVSATCRMGSLKCNADATLFPSLVRYGAGLCLRVQYFIQAKSLHSEGSGLHGKPSLG